MWLLQQLNSNPAYCHSTHQSITINNPEIRKNCGILLMVNSLKKKKKFNLLQVFKPGELRIVAGSRYLECLRDTSDCNPSPICSDSTHCTYLGGRLSLAARVWWHPTDKRALTCCSVRSLPHHPPEANRQGMWFRSPVAPAPCSLPPFHSTDFLCCYYFFGRSKSNNV